MTHRLRSDHAAASEPRFRAGNDRAASPSNTSVTGAIGKRGAFPEPHEVRAAT